MSWHSWWLFLITETALSISPGPAVLLVIAQAIRLGGPRALWAALGIVSANTIWFAISALGLAAAILTSAPWYLAIKWLGAGYLVYLALSPLVGKTHFFAPPSTQVDAQPSRVGPRPVPDLPADSAYRIWLRGLLMQMANPKALIFFAALLPQFVKPEGHYETQILILGLTSILVELPILAIYAIVAAQASTWVRGQRFTRLADCLVGALLIAVALSLAWGVNEPPTTQGELPASGAERP